jgi:hypothetical protein
MRANILRKKNVAFNKTTTPTRYVSGVERLKYFQSMFSKK